MRIRRQYLGVIFASSALAGLFAVSACGGEEFACEDSLSCGTGGKDAGTGATGGTGGTGATGGSGGTGGAGGTSGTGGAGGGSGGTAGSDGGTCDTTKSPSEEVCLVDDQYGVFVSPTGDDSTGDGAKATPYKTLGKALSAAATAGKSIYACDNGTALTETSTLSVTASHDGHGMYGGFDCTSWSWSPSTKVKVSAAAIALAINGVPNSFVIEGFDITAANAANSGETSVGAMVVNSKGVAFKGVKITAGDGKAGDAGANGNAGADAATAMAAQNGTAVTCTGAPGTQDGGKWPGANECGSKGGNGGIANKSLAGESGAAGLPQTNVTPPSVSNGGGAGSGTGNGVGGTAGSNGNAGTLGSPASAAAFTSAGFTAANGNDGSSGFPGQGGGGGGASASSSSSATCIGASGGAGGMGGCGGGKGTGGKGGGASVALLSWQSTVTLSGCELTSKKGGDGGKGGDAAAGGLGKSGGGGGIAASGLGGGGDGGKGGTGGPGGSGSGASGGPSHALVWSGDKPKTSTTTLSEGTGGAKGPGGKLQGSGLSPAPDGSAGAVAKEYEQK